MADEAFIQRVLEIYEQIRSGSRDSLSVPEAPELEAIDGVYHAHLLLPEEQHGIAAFVDEGEICAVVGRNDQGYDVVCLRENGIVASMGIAGLFKVSEGSLEMRGTPIILTQQEDGFAYSEVTEELWAMVHDRLVESAIRTMVAWTIKDEIENQERVLN